MITYDHYGQSYLSGLKQILFLWYIEHKPQSCREAVASPTEFPQHCVLLVPPFAMGFTGSEGLVDAMKKQNDHLSSSTFTVGEKGESTLFERKGKKDPSIRSKTETHLGPCRNLQILSQNLFNPCMGDATASLRDCGLCLDHVTLMLTGPQGSQKLLPRPGVSNSF